MYMHRKVDLFLKKWKENFDRMPLIIRGSRQVGKTESIRQFAKDNYQQVIEINFVRDAKYKGIISDGFDPDSIIRNITLINPSLVFIPQKTLIFFDEITEFPEIATSLKFFKEDRRYDVICSGSMLGVNYKKIESNSVGNKTDYDMSSMDFEEFLWAKGYHADLTESMLLHMLEMKPFSDLEMNRLSSLFLEFTILGGMPAVIRDYITKGTFEGSLDTQRQLVLDYKEDIRKYANGVDQTRILNVFQRIAPQLAQDNKKFQISKVAKGARFYDYRGCVDWLCDAGIVKLCHCLSFPELPLKGNYDPDKFKIYMADTGLLISMLDDEAQEDLRANRNFGVYKGALYENTIAESLSKQGYDLFYYKKEDSTLEEDFFVRSTDYLIPVEVKARSGKSKSMKTLINSSHYPDISFGFKFSANNIGYSNQIYTFPSFCSFLLRTFLRQFVPIQSDDDMQELP